jgi:hypothetical protein
MILNTIRPRVRPYYYTYILIPDTTDMFKLQEERRRLRQLRGAKNWQDRNLSQ